MYCAVQMKFLKVKHILTSNTKPIDKGIPSLLDRPPPPPPPTPHNT